MWNGQTLEFFIREVAINLRRNPLMNLAAISTVALALFVLGSGFLVRANIEALAEREARRVEIRAFLEPGLKTDRIETLRNQIAALPGVAGVTFVSSDEALARLQEQLQAGDLLDELKGENRLPASFDVKTKTLSEVEPTAAQIESLAGVAKVQCGQRIVRRLQQVVRVLHLGGLGGLILLGLATMGIINNAIRLAIFARRREIRIMQLVGATDWFIRVPFLLEGVVQGLVGALLAAVPLISGYRYLASKLPPIPGLSLIDESRWLLVFALALLGLGMLLGLGGSLLSIRRFLAAEP